MRTQLVGMIWAQAGGGVIGRGGAMPWHLPEDLAYFKTMTEGCPVIMGRKTWDSLPERFRPLPKRTNVVVTGDAGRARTLRSGGALTASSLKEALELAAQKEPKAPITWIMGGGSIYAEALEKGLADLVSLTRIDLQPEGDTFAPALGPEWAGVGKVPAEGWKTSETGVRYRFETYRREDAS